MFSLVKRVISILLLSTTFFTFSFWPAFASTTYTYDANGNMTSDGTNCYTYNEDNDLTQVRNCSSGQLKGEYVYDDQGNRIIQKIYQNGVLFQTVYTPTRSFEATKIASNGQFQNTSYYILDGQILARKNSDGTKTFYHNDTLGSATLLTNQTGQLVENTTYYPFGGIKTGGTQSKFLYTGQKRDSETGLDYYNARYYNDQIDRFTQPDSIVSNVYNPQNLNRYSYVYNNPLTLTDPSGRSATSICANISAGFLGFGEISGCYAEASSSETDSNKTITTTTTSGVTFNSGGGPTTGLNTGIGVSFGYDPDAKTVSDLGGKDTSQGISGPFFGGDHSTTSNAFSFGPSFGIPITIFGIVPIPFEYHATFSNTITKTLFAISIKEVNLSNVSQSTKNGINQAVKQSIAQSGSVNTNQAIGKISTSNKSSNTLSNAGTPTYNFANTLSSHGFDLNFFKTLKL